eukprot:Nitzschia sp. Nitz4//scaffold198_size39746//37591//39705//NITZ4_007608-RA/size39746-augustus-gene-0.6-mRNA-1//1//CDS//3329540539//8661//frame0
MPLEYETVSEAVTRRRPISPYSSAKKNTSSQDPQEAPKEKLKRSLQLTDLIFYGVGCSVGAGIYSLVGIGADLAGPSIALSFLLCGIACCFTSLAYAEFAARVPLAGSAYTFTYVSFGELCGWLVGWNLTLGYAISAAVVARSWAEYILGFVDSIDPSDKTHFHWLTHAPFHIPFMEAQYVCCPLAMLIVALSTVVLISGAKESTRFNTAMTILNLSILAFVLLAGLGSDNINMDNLVPVFPHGVAGMARGAGLVFFAFLGFDMVSCLSEEVENPARNMPIGIIGSLVASMSIYVAISVAVVGMAPIHLLGGDIPIVNALLVNACCTHEQQIDLGDSASEVCLTSSCSPVLNSVLFAGSRIVSFGAIFGLTTATFACLMGQPRIFYSMAQDGLLFKIYARVNPKTGVPTVGTVLTGIFTALIACFIDLEFLANAISLGTLQVFTFVNAGVIILRTRPAEDLEPSLLNDALNVESSPLVQDPSAAATARSLGLVKKSSQQIRQSIRNLSPTAPESNGSKPHWLTAIFTFSCLLVSIGLSNDWSILLMISFATIALICAVLLFLLPQASTPDTFTCPMVPLVPLMGILCNSYMMGSMPLTSWSVITIWLLGGVVFYFSYGIHHSELRVRKPEDDNISMTAESAGSVSQQSHLLIPPASQGGGRSLYSSIPTSTSSQF